MKHTLTIPFLLLMLGASVPASADSEGVIKYRQGVMNTLGGHMGAMAMVLRGKADYKDNLLVHAQGLHAMLRIAPNVFPADSDFGETRALAKIWESMDDFKAKASDAEKAAANLVKAAESGDMQGFANAFNDVGKSCKACHKEYREEDR